MSERQAKLKRKNEIIETPKKKRNPMDIVFNIIIVVLIVAVLGVGSWAVYSKYSQMPKDTTSEGTEQAVPTLAEYAETLGLSVEEFVADYGLTGDEGITAETDMNEVINHLTVANYAKLSQTDAKTILDSFGADNGYTEETLMSDIFADLAAESEAQEASDAATEEAAE